MLLKWAAISTSKAGKSWIVSTLKSSSSLGVAGGGALLCAHGRCAP